MQHLPFSGMPCPVARALDRVGAWWSILILRDAFHGLTRFDQFQKSLPIAPNTLSRRLSELVEAGLLEKRRYSERPPRDDYVLTDAGRDFFPVLVTLMEWGNRHFAPEGPSSVLLEGQSGSVVHPVLVDEASGRRVTEETTRFAAGPAADADVKRRMAFVERQQDMAFVERQKEKRHGE